MELRSPLLEQPSMFPALAAASCLCVKSPVTFPRDFLSPVCKDRPKYRWSVALGASFSRSRPLSSCAPWFSHTLSSTSDFEWLGMIRPETRRRFFAFLFSALKQTIRLMAASHPNPLSLALMARGLLFLHDLPCTPVAQSARPARVIRD